MTRQTLAVLPASGAMASSLLDELSAIGVASDHLCLLDSDEHKGKRIPYGSGSLTIGDQSEYDFENLLGVILLSPDEELQGLLEYADCPVITTTVNSDEDPDWLPGDDFQRLQNFQGIFKLPQFPVAMIAELLVSVANLPSFTSVNCVDIKTAGCQGPAALQNLASQTIDLLNQRESSGADEFSLAFNLLPQHGDSSLLSPLSAFAVESEPLLSYQSIQVPAFHGRALAINLGFSSVIDLAEITQHWSAISGVELHEEPISSRTHCLEGVTDHIYGLEQAQKDAKRLQFWIMSDSVKNRLLQNYLSVSRFLLNSFL